MRLAKLVVAVAILMVLSAARAEEATAQSARVRVSVTIVSPSVSPAATDSLVASAEPTSPGRLVAKGVRVIVKEPARGQLKDRTRKVEVHYVGV